MVIGGWGGGGRKDGSVLGFAQGSRETGKERMKKRARHYMGKPQRERSNRPRGAFIRTRQSE